MPVLGVLVVFEPNFYDYKFMFDLISTAKYLPQVEN